MLCCVFIVYFVKYRNICNVGCRVDNVLFLFLVLKKKVLHYFDVDAFHENASIIDMVSESILIQTQYMVTFH